MSKWQLIETAPKQKVILLFAVTSSDPENWKMDTGHWLDGFRGEPGYWIWEGRKLAAYEIQPTHWMPLPEPPL